MDPKEFFDKPSPLEMLFCWVQLGDERKAREFVSSAIKAEVMFIKVLNSTRGWSDSSDRGVYHPLKTSYLAHFMDVDAAKARLEAIAMRNDPDPALSKAAAELLREWSEDRQGNPNKERPHHKQGSRDSRSDTGSVEAAK